MNPPIGFIDTETTSLGPQRRAWEVALLIPNGSHLHKHEWFIDSADLDLGNADPMSLRVGRFYERHPFGLGRLMAGRALGRDAVREVEVLRAVERLTRGVQLHGSRPEFDMATLEPRMRANGLLPAWYHHPIDVPSMAIGYLRALGRPLPEKASSEELSRAVGVEPNDFDRHTAMGDCLWQYHLYTEITRDR